MQVLGSLATLAFIIVGAMVGIRLLILGQKTRGLPERAIGLALLLVGGVGYPMAIAAGTPGLLAPALGVKVMALSSFVMNLGFIGIVLFTWSVFRRNELWARVVMIVLSICYAVHAVLMAQYALGMSSPAEMMKGATALTLFGQAMNAVVFCWTAAEAYRYWWMLRKRMAIGLGDPVTTNRFLLWAIAATGSVLTNAISWWVIVERIDFFASPVVQASIGILSLASCASQYLAFLPPKAYLARLQAA